MAKDPKPHVKRRADASRNRERIIAVSRAAFDGANAADVSMAEIARLANVGMATLYRNFPGKRQLLEAIFTDEVDELCAAARPARGCTLANPWRSGSPASSTSPSPAMPLPPS